MANPTTPSPGEGYTWVPGQWQGGEGGSMGEGFWAPPNGVAPVTTPAQNTVGGPNAAINANWRPPQPIQNQLNELLTNPVSGYSPNANYGNQYGQTGFGRFMFSGTAPVPQTAPYGWGRYPGVDGSPPSASWLAGQTMPPPQWYHGAGAGTGGGGGGGGAGGGGGGVPPPVTPPVTPPNNGGWTPNGPPASWTGRSGAGVTPAMTAAHQAARAARGASYNAPQQAVTTPIDQAAVLARLGQANPQVWQAPTQNAQGQQQSLQWSPGDFANTGPGSLSSWQQNWNALPPALRVAYGQATGSGELLRSIYQNEGASTQDGANLVNSMSQNGVRYAVENGQLVQKSVNAQGQWTTTPLANLLNPQAPRKVRSI
jgi:hypothetical protein